MYPYNIDNEPEDKPQASIISAALPTKAAKEKVRHSKPDEKLLEMINEAIKSEIKDAEKYESLINQVKPREDKEILRTIKMNSIKAERLLKRIYMDIVGTGYAELTVQGENIIRNEKESLGEEFLECMFECLKDVEYYRKLYFAFINEDMRDILYEIITDNQSDSTKFLYLETKYKTL